MPGDRQNPAELASHYYLSATEPLATYRDVVHHYIDGAYEPLDDGQVLHDIRDSIATAQSTRAATAATVKATFESLRQISYLPASLNAPFWRDGRPGRPIVMTNGLLDVAEALAGSDQALSPHDPDYFALNKLPYAYDLTAECPAWDAFMTWFTQGDQAVIDLLAEFVAWCILLPSLALQRFVVLLGPGANGKSVFTHVLAHIVGLANVSSVPIERFDDRFSLVQTLGKLVNIVPDCSDIDRCSEGAVKQLVGGDLMYFDRKNRTPIITKPTAKLLVCANRMPHWRDKSDGIWRRLIVVLCLNKVTHEQVNLADELCKEAPGILTKWVLPAAKRLAARRRFEAPTVCRLALDEARVTCNPAQRFCREQLIAGPASSDLPKDGLYETYRDWCAKWGYLPLSYASLTEEIKTAFPKSYETRARGNKNYRPRVWAGIEWRADREFIDEQVDDFTNAPVNEPTPAASDKLRIHTA
jgi:putative DNA primase/helicase